MSVGDGVVDVRVVAAEQTPYDAGLAPQGPYR